MKIYTRCVYAWRPDGTPRLEAAESFEYAGPVAHCKSSPSPPPAPDYTGAAEATAEGNINAARSATTANRVNQYTPYGSIEYGQFDPDNPDRWRSDINLSPTGQKLLDAHNQSSLSLSGLQGQASERVKSGLNKPFDYGSVGDVSDASYAAQTARLDPQWQAREEQERTRLANQGVSAGGEAYGNEMRTFNQGRNDAYTQARLAAISTQPQTFQLAQALRSQPLNELNALRTGSQVQNPQFTGVPQQQTTPGPDMLGAAQGEYGGELNKYNAGVGSANSMNSGLMSMAAMAAMYF